jgi:hypothetical protein
MRIRSIEEYFGDRATFKHNDPKVEDDEYELNDTVSIQCNSARSPTVVIQTKGLFKFVSCSSAAQACMIAEATLKETV